MGLREILGAGEGDKATERLQDIALCRRAKQRRRNTLAHDIADDDVEAAVAVPVKVVEVAIDPLRWNRQRRDPDPCEIARWWLEQQSLLDLEADLDLVLARQRKLQLNTLPLSFGAVDGQRIPPD